MENLDTILLELSRDIKECLDDRFSKVIIVGNDENYRKFREYFDKSIYASDILSEKIEHLTTNPKAKNGVYVIDIDYVLNSENFMDMQIHRRQKLEYDLRTKGRCCIKIYKKCSSS